MGIGLRRKDNKLVWASGKNVDASLKLPEMREGESEPPSASLFEHFISFDTSSGIARQRWHAQPKNRSGGM
jgi:hypothetical protein